MGSSPPSPFRCGGGVLAKLVLSVEGERDPAGCAEEEEIEEQVLVEEGIYLDRTNQLFKISHNEIKS